MIARVALAATAVSALVPGLQGTLGPHGFYTGFPFGRGWVALLPPFNEHLVRDIGAFYLAFALLFAWAATTLERALVLPLTVAWCLFGVLHAVYHVTHLERFGAGDAIAEVAALVAVFALPLLALRLLGAGTGARSPGSSATRAG
jgi:hypothetical protein